MPLWVAHDYNKEGRRDGCETWQRRAGSFGFEGGPLKVFSLHQLDFALALCVILLHSDLELLLYSAV